MTDVLSRPWRWIIERINVRIDTRLKRELEAEAQAQGVPMSDVVREALEEYLRSKPARLSCFELAERLSIVGVFKGGPPDLSTNPKYMEGFGE